MSILKTASNFIEVPPSLPLMQSTEAAKAIALTTTRGALFEGALRLIEERAPVFEEAIIIHQSGPLKHCNSSGGFQCLSDICSTKVKFRIHKGHRALQLTKALGAYFHLLDQSRQVSA